MINLQESFETKLAGGSKLLVPYVTGGYPNPGWVELVEGCVGVGCDAVEIGLPFSDPVMDGPTIQESSKLALEGGVTAPQVLAKLAKKTFEVPLIAMTYYNIVFRMGHQRFASELAAAGFAGAIIPDLPMEESVDFAADASDSGISNILLGAPTANDDRLAAICEASDGFVYAVGLVGTTGERSELASSSLDIAKRLKSLTDKPVLVGVGVSNPEQAVEIATVADGVIIGSALIRRVLDTGSPSAGVEFIASVREALDAM